MFEKDYEERCSICGYIFSNCQCKFTGSGHPDRSKRIAVVKDHLYLLSPAQLKHFIEVERSWNTSYSDPVKSLIFLELLEEHNEKN